MFGAHALYLLWKYLGEYIEGLFVEALRVWKGGFILKDLRLNGEARNSLNPPIMLKVVFIGLAIQVLYLLLKYLGGDIDGLFAAALRVWKGVFVFKDLKLKAEQLSSLNLPVTVKAVFIDTITIQIPWKSLRRGTNIVLIDHIFVVLAEPASDGYTPKDEDKKKFFESKLKQRKAPSKIPWLSSLFANSFGDLNITFSNVHIRYEDSISNPGHPFCSGITLSKLVFSTTDEQDNETFDANGALDKLRESLQMLRLAVDHDSESAPWKLGKSWKDLNSVDWTENFQDGIDELDGNKIASLWAKDLRYLVFTINGALKYHLVENLEGRKPLNHYWKATVVLSDVYFTISEAQYYWCINLLEAMSTYNTRLGVSHLRPDVPVLEDTHAWWRYAMLASLQQKKLRCWFSWERIKHFCQLRRLYVQMYSTFLKQAPSVDIYAMRNIERSFDSEVVLLWRWLARSAMRRIWPAYGWFLLSTSFLAVIVIYLRLAAYLLSWYK